MTHQTSWLESAGVGVEMQAQLTLSSVTQVTCMTHSPVTVAVTQSMLADWQYIAAQ